MPIFDYAILAAGTILWCAPFPFVRSKHKGALTIDRRARWGVFLQFAGYTLLWQGAFWTRSPAVWQVFLSVLCFALASLLSWTGAPTLGRSLRVDAAVDENQPLIRSGPYRFLRHPIYTSMLFVLLATGLLISPPVLFLGAIVLFVAGAEIRMRIEDALLATRFGNRFEEYRHTVPRWLPFI